MNENEILEIDQNYVWHPYSAVPSLIDSYAVERADGVIITLKNGNRMIDGMSSWWSAIHGYNHPTLNKAIEKQLQKASHIMFGGLTHEPAAILCKKLVDITPHGLNKVFLSDSGSVSVEVAIKMALQYWHAQNMPTKNRLLTIRGGYHGDTFATMAISDLTTGMHHQFKENLTQHYFADRPKIKFENEWNEHDIASLEKIIRENHQNIAAVILEPIVQGAGGMWFYSPHYLKQARYLCNKFNVLLICDEIATGFARTGKLFACEHAEISPDILCLGKALTGGYLTLAATLCTDQLANTIGTLMHGPTFMANPLACAVANASIDLLLQSDWQTNIARVEQQLKQGLFPAKKITGVSDVRVLGAIGVIELQKAVEMQSIQPMFVDSGIWLRPFGRLVYTMPPYTMNSGQLDELCNKILYVLENYLSQQTKSS